MPPRRTPEPQPSVSPEPSISEDVARVWHDDDDDDDDDDGPAASGSGSKGYLSPSSSRAGLRGKGKGKGKAVSRERSASGNEDEDGVDGATEGYPPTKEEEAEARRVAENLRRWEIAERQRRKAARESASSVAPSLLTELRTSLFRRDSHRKVPPSGPGTHHALRMDDADGDPAEDDAAAAGVGAGAGESLPLEELRTPTGAAFDAPRTPEPENPFDTPMASRTSLNIPAQSAIMTESDSIPADFAQAAAGDPKGPKRPTLEASSSFANPAAAAAAAKKQPPPPPQPIDLPAPRSPPPRTGTPHADKPPEPIPPPRAAPPEPEPEPEREEVVDDGPPVRWWHEWLCGCGEGPDRGGDHQAGRTNPFE